MIIYNKSWEKQPSKPWPTLTVHTQQEKFYIFGSLFLLQWCKDKKPLRTPMILRLSTQPSLHLTLSSMLVCIHVYYLYCSYIVCLFNLVIKFGLFTYQVIFGKYKTLYNRPSKNHGFELLYIQLSPHTTKNCDNHLCCIKSSKNWSICEKISHI